MAILNNNTSWVSSGVMIVVTLLSLVVFTVTFWPTLIPLHERWSEVNQTYSHGYLVVLMVVYSYYQQVRLTTKAEWESYQSSKLTLILAFGVSFVWLVGYGIQIQIFQQMVIPAAIWVWIAAVIGWRGAFPYLAPTLFLYLAIPLWGFLLLPLRGLTIAVVQFGVDLVNIPAFVDGFRIHLSYGVLEVANDCSGLGYMLVSLVLGCYYAYTSFTSPIKRGTVILVSIVLALLSNWVRVFVLVLIAHNSKMESEIIYDHGSLGWFIYAVLVIVFFFLTRKYEDLPVRASQQRANTNNSHSQIIFPSSMVSAAIVVTMLLVLLPLWARWQAAVEFDQNIDILTDLRGHDLAGFRNSDDFWLPEFEGFDLKSHLPFTVENTSYELTILTYLSQSQGKELVYYTNRLGSEVAVKNLPVMVLDGEIDVNQSVVYAQGGSRMVWWGYWVGGYFTTSPILSKLYQLPELLKGGSHASLFVLSMACETVFCEKEMKTVSGRVEHQQLLREILGGLR